MSLNLDDKEPACISQHEGAAGAQRVDQHCAGGKERERPPVSVMRLKEEAGVPACRTPWVTG